MEWVSAFFRWWGWWLLLAAVPGAANVIMAWGQLEERCKYLPFFRPFRVRGFWFWAGIQFLAPASLYWVTMGLQKRPELAWEGVGKAIGFGLGFSALMNSRTQLRKQTVDFAKYYSLFTGWAYNLIAGAETNRTAHYLTDLESELLASTSVSAGISHLINYIEIDIALSPAEKTRRVKQLETVRDNLHTPPHPSQVKALRSLIDVRRRDLRDVLEQFGCHPPFLNKYFPGR